MAVLSNIAEDSEIFRISDRGIRRYKVRDFKSEQSTQKITYARPPVSLAHELSAEIAIAILSNKDRTNNLDDLKAIVLNVHKTLQTLSSGS